MCVTKESELYATFAKCVACDACNTGVGAGYRGASLIRNSPAPL